MTSATLPKTLWGHVGRAEQKDDQIMSRIVSMVSSSIKRRRSVNVEKRRAVPRGEGIKLISARDRKFV